MDKNKWNNYFGNIENKYNLKMNKNNPVVIFVDGKDITKSYKHNLIDESKNSFNDIFEQTIKYFSMKFECIAISGVDEVSFIFEDPQKLKDFMLKNKFMAQDIVSRFSQHFYKYFNDRYSNGSVYWHCKCSNIPKGKIKSYISYRSLTIFELQLTYFLKRRQIKDAGKIELSKKIQKCNEIADYMKIKEFERGRLYSNGEQIDLDCFLNGQIIKLPEINRKDSIKFLDINNF